MQESRKVPKKSLDDYNSKVKKGLLIGYDFIKNYDRQVSHLRKFIKSYEQTAVRTVPVTTRKRVRMYRGCPSRGNANSLNPVASQDLRRIDYERRLFELRKNIREFEEQKEKQSNSRRAASFSHETCIQVSDSLSQITI